MLSMINPDTLSRYDHTNKAALQMSQKQSQEHFYEEMEDSVHQHEHAHAHKMPMPANKTTSNFYQAQNQIGDSGKRPGSANVEPAKPRVVSHNHLLMLFHSEKQLHETEKTKVNTLRKEGRIRTIGNSQVKRHKCIYFGALHYL